MSKKRPTTLSGKDLREWRRVLRMNREQLAILLGVHWYTIGRWERGEIAPPLGVQWALERILQVTGVDPEMELRK